VLDPEQNSEFRDNYLEVAYDLSQVFFITTANTQRPSRGLYDRGGSDLSLGYTDNEMRGLPYPAADPREWLQPAEIHFTDEALRESSGLTRWVGVRSLEWKIGAIVARLERSGRVQRSSSKSL
jgi:ATP-dependent Lon protease